MNGPDTIPAERLARYVERIAAVLESEGEEKVDDMDADPSNPYLAIWRQLALFEGLSAEGVEQVDRMAELLASNRRQGIRPR
ncbi:hypothetical protein [Streptomyces tendae]|uniref:hypothetical protein n=1 Tax=Streptomyces tendae TaxID=1932 RepID=UPI003D742858